MTRPLYLHRRTLRTRSSFLILALLFYIFMAPQISRAAKTQELLLGIEPEHNIFDQMQKYRVLSGYLSEQLGLEVKLTIMSRYGEIVNRFRSLRLDGAVLSSFTTELAIKELGLAPVATMVREDGGSTSQGLILVRKDSGINDVNDMRGKRIVFADPATIEGYVFAKAFFRQHGIDQLGSFFKQHSFSGSHASVVYAILDGRSDIGAAKNTVYDQIVAKDPSIGREIRIIDESPSVPEVTLCVKNDLDSAVLEKLQTLLLNMDQTVEGHRVLRTLGAKRFARTTFDDFAIVSELKLKAGLNEEGSGNSK